MDPRSLLTETVPFLSPRPALDGVTPELADRRVPGAPHTIAEIVAHMTFWLDWFVGRCEGSGTPMPHAAAIGWPPVEAGTWDALRQRFLDALDRLAVLGAAADADVRRVEPPMEFPPIAGYTVRELIVHVAMHDAHHLGQIVLLRQMLGAWPPPAGAYTW